MVWWGRQRQMPLVQLASYIAPVYWFSPDEPLLRRAEGIAISLPEALPFETSVEGPVVYYQLDEVVQRGPGSAAYIESPSDRNQSLLDLERTGTLKMQFLAYFSSEIGVGAHPHDFESAEFKVAVLPSQSGYVREQVGPGCPDDLYLITVTRVTAKAHGMFWFWNILDVDDETLFPFHLLVEEGKHALATDKNSDGYYSPGYDVTRHLNDAWGVRDVIRSGTLFSGAYHSWMTKARFPEHRVFPPLPPDSPLRRRLPPVGTYAEYQLRPLPPSGMARYDAGLYRFIESKEVVGWPEINQASSLDDLLGWAEQGAVAKSLGIALRMDGDLGVSVVFPLLLVKNFEDPLGGGFIVQRVYMKGKGLTDFGWGLLYTPSASRWFDTYLAAGAERDSEVDDTAKTRTIDLVVESGVKLRVNLSGTPLRFLGFLTDFWGLRIGIKHRGGFEISRLSYVVEIGAGVW
jgi:hypothetical protein